MARQRSMPRQAPGDQSQHEMIAKLQKDVALLSKANFELTHRIEVVEQRVRETLKPLDDSALTKAAIIRLMKELRMLP